MANIPIRTKKPDVMGEIKRIHKQVLEQQEKFDTGEYKTYGGALGLQDLKAALKEERSKLPKLTLVVNND